MPKSKRSTYVSLTKVSAKGKEGKSQLIEEIRQCVEEYKNIFVFEPHNMRSNFLKDIRTQWTSSRFFLGKNKVMQVALGKSETDEYKPELHKVAELVVGSSGLLFTNETEAEVRKFFDQYKEIDYPRAGFEATRTITLDQGPLPQFAHSMEPYLRNQLGMPTSLKHGVVLLETSFTVATAGQALTPEQARILKLLDIKMSEFHVTLSGLWTNGTFKQL